MKLLSKYSLFFYIIKPQNVFNSFFFLSEKPAFKERGSTQLEYDDILINDILLIKLDLDSNQQCYAKCADKNSNKKQIYVYYNQTDSK